MSGSPFDMPYLVCVHHHGTPLTAKQRRRRIHTLATSELTVGIDISRTRRFIIPDDLLTPAEVARKPRSPRRPTAAYLTRLASKPGIARIEVKPDGGFDVVVGEPSAAADINPWDEVLTNAADQKRPS